MPATYAHLTELRTAHLRALLLNTACPTMRKTIRFVLAERGHRS